MSDLSELLDDQLKILGHSLTVDSKKTLVNAFMASCLDFCNSLCHGVGDQGSTGQIWASSDCGGQTRKLGNTTIFHIPLVLHVLRGVFKWGHWAMPLSAKKFSF